MFSLLYGLWEYIFRKEELRILITGLDKSGKTTLLEKIKVRARCLWHCRQHCLLPACALHMIEPVTRTFEDSSAH